MQARCLCLSLSASRTRALCLCLLENERQTCRQSSDCHLPVRPLPARAPGLAVSPNGAHAGSPRGAAPICDRFSSLASAATRRAATAWARTTAQCGSQGAQEQPAMVPRRRFWLHSGEPAERMPGLALSTWIPTQAPQARGRMAVLPPSGQMPGSPFEAEERPMPSAPSRVRRGKELDC